MSFADAHAFAFSLATLMVAIVIFRAGDGTLSVVPANEYDGDTPPSSAKSTRSPHDGADIAPGDARTPAGFARASLLLCCALRQVVVEGAIARAILSETPS
ncbi:hypothetical protein [Mesorhizobium sp. M0589]|uniref:hypothetical protein n=1 Tax=Mesorhizobium sp. M0589 TaxID=2956965 RepID=UPI00333852A0